MCKGSGGGGGGGEGVLLETSHPFWVFFMENFQKNQDKVINHTVKLSNQTLHYKIYPLSTNPGSAPVHHLVNI